MVRAVELRIREAQEQDLPAIVAIYNASIPGGWSTADTRPIRVEDRLSWFRSFESSRRPIWVAEAQHRPGLVLATTYLSSFYQGRPAYDATAEISVYVAPDQQRRGIGRQLKQWVIDQCPRLGITTLLSFYFDHNQATRKLNDRFGFETVGHLRDIALVQGESRGLVIAALRIPPLPSCQQPPSLDQQSASLAR
ncbi:MAG: GNAT family N-acetyltransferase [Synechococcaceae cyanobacterium]|nr:GNAT family N-acetyltransferase [Synechococcaceae cyanobacterium]